MTAENLDTDAPAAKGARPGQVTTQLLCFAAPLNKVTAQKLVTSPKLALSAAVLAFAAFDPEIQVEYLNKARAEHARHESAAE
jgi:hypothetical protein